VAMNKHLGHFFGLSLQIFCLFTFFGPISCHC